MRRLALAILITSSIEACKDDAFDTRHSRPATTVWEYASGIDWVEYRGRQYVPSPDDRDRSWRDDWSGPLVLTDSAIAKLQWVSTCMTASRRQTGLIPSPAYVAMVPWYLSKIDNDLSEEQEPLFHILNFLVSYVPRTTLEQEEETKAWMEGAGAKLQYVHEFAKDAYRRVWQPSTCIHAQTDDSSTYFERVVHEFDGNTHRLIGELSLGEIAGTGIVTWRGTLIPYNQWEIGRLAALSCAWLNSNAPEMVPDDAVNADPSRRVPNEARRSQMALLNYLMSVGIPFRAGFYVDISTDLTTGPSPKHRAEGTFFTVLDALRLNGSWSCDAREGKAPYFFTVLK